MPCKIVSNRKAVTVCQQKLKFSYACVKQSNKLTKTSECQTFCMQSIEDTNLLEKCSQGKLRPSHLAIIPPDELPGISQGKDMAIHAERVYTQPGNSFLHFQTKGECFSWVAKGINCESTRGYCWGGGGVALKPRIAFILKLCMAGILHSFCGTSTKLAEHLMAYLSLFFSVHINGRDL